MDKKDEHSKVPLKLIVTVREYQMPSADNKLTPHFNKLSDIQKSAKFREGKKHMDYLALARCPRCHVSKVYDSENKTCVDCWFRVLDSMCVDLEIAPWALAGWHIVK
jgi:hypothetical protein